MKAGALILLVVFGVKAAVVPLYLWLPNTYAAASAPVAALFAIMTKVGVYSIIRVHGVIFGESAGHASLAIEPWLLPVALTTAVLGVLGALAATSLARMVGYLNISSVGIILMAVGLFSPAALSAAIYYSVHSTLVVAALFLLVELVASQRGEAADRLQPAGPLGQPMLLGLMTLLAAASVTGLPPLPGFLGKVMILQSVQPGPAQIWIWATVLGVGFLTLIGLARAGSMLFWNLLPGSSATQPRPARAGRLTAATLGLLGISMALAAAASPVKRYTDAAAAQLSDHEGYARAVLGPAGQGADDATRRYRAGEGEIILPEPKDLP